MYSFCIFIDEAYRVINFPLQLAYSEGPILEQILRLSKFENIYSPSFSKHPYLVSNYPPLYHIIQIPFMWLFGTAYWYGRLISTISICIIAILIALVTNRLTSNRFAAFTSGMLLFSTSIMLEMSISVWTDPMALMLSFAGVSWIILNKISTKNIVICALLLVAAGYTKHSYVFIGSIASFLFIGYNSSFKRAIYFFLIYSGLGVIIFLILNIMTSGGFFLNVITANINEYSIKRYFEGIMKILHYLIFIIVPILFIAKIKFDVKIHLIPLIFMAGGLITSLMYGKSASNIAYFSEFIIGICLI